MRFSHLFSAGAFVFAAGCGQGTATLQIQNLERNFDSVFQNETRLHEATELRFVLDKATLEDDKGNTFEIFAAPTCAIFEAEDEAEFVNADGEVEATVEIPAGTILTKLTLTLGIADADLAIASEEEILETRTVNTEGFFDLDGDPGNGAEQLFNMYAPAPAVIELALDNIEIVKGADAAIELGFDLTAPFEAVDATNAVIDSVDLDDDGVNEDVLFIRDDLNVDETDKIAGEIEDNNGVFIVQ